MPSLSSRRNFFDFRDLRERVGTFELQKAFAEGDFLHFYAAMFGFELFEFAGVSLDVGAQVVDLLVPCTMCCHCVWLL